MILSLIKLVFLACYDSTKCSCLCYASQSLQLYYLLLMETRHQLIVLTGLLPRASDLRGASRK